MHSRKWSIYCVPTIGQFIVHSPKWSIYNIFTRIINLIITLKTFQKLTLTEKIHWLSGHPPKDEPNCGFGGCKRDWKPLIIGIAVSIVFIFILVLFLRWVAPLFYFFRGGWGRWEKTKLHNFRTKFIYSRLFFILFFLRLFFFNYFKVFA